MGNLLTPSSPNPSLPPPTPAWGSGTRGGHSPSWARHLLGISRCQFTFCEAHLGDCLFSTCGPKLGLGFLSPAFPTQGHRQGPIGSVWQNFYPPKSILRLHPLSIPACLQLPCLLHSASWCTVGEHLEGVLLLGQTGKPVSKN